MDDVLTIYTIMSEMAQKGGEARKDELLYAVRSKGGVSVSEKEFELAIKSYVDENIFQYSDDKIKLGSESGFFRKPEIFRKVWRELPPTVREGFVYSGQEYSPLLKKDYLWQLATSPSKKAWTDAFYFFKIHVDDDARIKQLENLQKNIQQDLDNIVGFKKRLAADEKVKMLEKYPELSFIKGKSGDESYYKAKNYAYEQIEKRKEEIKTEIMEFLEKGYVKKRLRKDEKYEYLFGWQNDFSRFLAKKLREYNTFEISRKDLTIPEEDIQMLEERMKSEFDGYRAEKINDLKKEKRKYGSVYFPHSVMRKKSFRRKRKRVNEVNEKIDGWKNKQSQIRYDEKCPLGLDYERCKREWKVNDSIDKFAYSDKSDSRIYLSALFPGLYITPRKPEVFMSVEEIKELNSLVEELYPLRPKKEELYFPKHAIPIRRWKSEKNMISLTMRENDDIHPPYSMGFFLPRSTMKKIVKEMKIKINKIKNKN